MRPQRKTKRYKALSLIMSAVLTVMSSGVTTLAESEVTVETSVETVQAEESVSAQESAASDTVTAQPEESQTAAAPETAAAVETAVSQDSAAAPEEASSASAADDSTAAETNEAATAAEGDTTEAAIAAEADSTEAATIVESDTTEAAENEDTEATTVAEEETTEAATVSADETAEVTDAAEDTTEAATEEENTEDATAEEETTAAESTVKSAAAVVATVADLQQASASALTVTSADVTVESAVSAIALGADATNAVTVAKIGDTEYATLDEAVAAAADDATIELVADATTSGLNLSKNLTINGNGRTVTFTDKGIALRGSSLTFNGTTVNLVGIGATSYAEWNWMTICASDNASLNLTNSTMTLDGTDAGNAHAIYFTGNNQLNLDNSTLTIKNYQQDALEWDGGSGYLLNIKNGSTYISDNNRSGITGTFYATIDNSTVSVTNSRGNGSNGTHYVITNESDVTFTGNRNWGISAYSITMSDNSTLTANDNGYAGIWTRIINADSTSTIDVERNGYQNNGNTNTASGIVFFGNGQVTSTIQNGASVTIKDNAGSGIYTSQSVCNLTIDTAAEIIGNGISAATYGGGIYNIGTLKLSEAVKIYNNHASIAGDDIYSSGSFTLTIDASTAYTEYKLDGTKDTTDCERSIDGWYDDSKDNRWTNHDEDSQHVEEVETGAASTVEGTLLAIKAAHGLVEEDEYDSVDFSFTKVDSATKEPISGVEFTFYSDEACTEVIGTVVSDENGVVKLPESVKASNADQTIYMKETKAADGYQAITDVFTLTIKSKSNADTALKKGEVTKTTTYSVDETALEGKAVVNDEDKVSVTNETETESETTPATEPETTPTTEPETTPATEPETTPTTEPETTPATEPETTPVTEPETTTEVETDTEEETDEDTEADTESTEKETENRVAAAAVKTGDNTPILPMALLMAVAFACIVSLIERKRRTGLNK